MPWSSIAEAHLFWRTHDTPAAPVTDLAEVETFILGASPSTLEDAAYILDIIVANEGDTRCDGQDYVALKRVQLLLAQSVGRDI